MASSLKNLQDLRTALGRLDAERPATGKPFPGRTMHAPRDGDFLRRLDLDITSRQDKARVLVTGQIGVGKSSELLEYLRLAIRDTPRRSWIYCDLEKEEHPDHCGPTGVLLTILRDCWSATKYFQERQNDPKYVRFRDEAFTRLTQWLNGIFSSDRSTVTFKFGGMDFPVAIHSGEPDRTLALILGKAAQHEAVSEPSKRFGLAPDSLLHLLNDLLNWFTGQTGNTPVIFVDHVDKIRNPVAAEEVLVKATPTWERLEASLIMTAPFEYTLGPLRNSIESKWGRPQVLFPAKLPLSPNEGNVPAIYDTIIRDAGLRPVVPPDSVRFLAYYSGGILRQFVQFLKDACKEAHLSRHDTVQASDAEAVIRAFEQAYLSYSTKDLDLLDEITRVGTGLGEAATLLRSPIGLLVEQAADRGQTLRVHPLAEAALERHTARSRIPA